MNGPNILVLFGVYFLNVNIANSLPKSSKQVLSKYLIQLYFSNIIFLYFRNIQHNIQNIAKTIEITR